MYVFIFQRNIPYIGKRSKRSMVSPTKMSNPLIVAHISKINFLNAKYAEINDFVCILGEFSTLGIPKRTFANCKFYRSVKDGQLHIK